MRGLFGCGVFALAVLSATNAMADVACVQQGLTDLGFNPGPVDGALGRRTAESSRIFAQNAGLTLPPLNAATAPDWCRAITEFAGTPAAASIATFDVAAEPTDLLDARTLERLWNNHKTAKVCFDFPQVLPGYAQQVDVIEPGQLATRPWKSPFTQVAGAPSCTVNPPILVIPEPVVAVELDERYGERQDHVDVAATWFRSLTAYFRLSSDPVASQVLREALVQWAEADALKTGINVSFGRRPVDYQMMAAIFSMLASTAAIAPELSEAEKAVIGPWLNRLVDRVGDSRWTFRQDNKQYMRAHLALIWGVMVGDSKPVQDAIVLFKQAIHDMRPDGSWPLDSSRSGMGLHYQAAATSQLVLIAATLRQNYDVDLFSYEVDGRSIHDAIDWVVAGMKTPVATNSEYAISCPEGGDALGSLERPNLHHFNEGGYLLVYASLFPERETSRYIEDFYEGFHNIWRGARPPLDSERNGAPAACYFAREGGTVSLAALELPPPPPTLPEPTFVVFGREEGARQTGAATHANSLFFVQMGELANRHDFIQFNVQARFFNRERANFAELRLALNPALDDETHAAYSACGGKIDTYDDGNRHAVIEFARDGENFVALNTECVSSALGGKVGFTADFLLDSLQDIAIGMVKSGEMTVVKNDGLKAFLTRVALGEISVGRPG